MTTSTESTANYREQLLAARETIVTLKEQAITQRELALAAVANRGRPILLNSRLVVFGSRKDVAEMLAGITPDTVSDLVTDGVLPAPCDLTGIRKRHAAKTQGRRLLMWDLHEAAEWTLKSRRLPHPALAKVSSGSPKSPSFGSLLHAL